MESKTEGEDRVDSESSGSSSAPKASTVSRKTDTIDDLLGGLSSDLEKIGVDTAAKGHCALCKKCIVGKVPLFTYKQLNYTYDTLILHLPSPPIHYYYCDNNNNCYSVDNHSTG